MHLITVYRLRCLLPAFCLLLAGFPSMVRADNWPQWRGPQRNGISTATSIPIEWSSENKVVWRAPMPGQGGATPVIWGDSMFVTSAEGDDLVLLCLDLRNGTQRWKRTVTGGNQDARAGEGNSASPSPSTDGQHVWVFFSTGVLACYDFQGEEQWKFDVGERFGKIDIQFGMASTPLLVDDYLYLQLIHGVLDRADNRRTGQVIKLDKLSGETVWVHERITQAVFECKQSYASPVLYDDGQQKFVIAHGADCTSGHSLETGEELWRLSGLNGPSDINTRHDDTFRFVASPAVAPGWIIVPTAKAGPLVALRVNDQLKGDVSSNPAVLKWHLSETPDVSIPLIVDGLVYLLHKDGKLQCVELATGKEVYHQRTHTVQHRSSPIYAEGRIYFCGKDGVCTVVKAGRDLDILAENEMNGESITASPITAGSTLYLRTYAAVYAIRN